MTDQDPCEICNSTAETVPTGGDYVHQICPRCGEFKLSGTASTNLRRLRSPELVAKLSGWVNEQDRSTGIPMISDRVLDIVIELEKPSVTSRAYRLLLEAVRLQEKLSDHFSIFDPRFISATYSQDETEVAVLLDHLIERKFVRQVGGSGGAYEVISGGHIEAERLREEALDPTVEVHTIRVDGSLPTAGTAPKASTATTDVDIGEGGFSNEFDDAFAKRPSGAAERPEVDEEHLSTQAEAAEPENIELLPRLDLRAPAERLVILSNPNGIAAASIEEEVGASLTSLKSLKEVLNGLVGMDAVETARGRNQQVAPMAEHDLALLRSLVSAAIEAETSPIITQGIGDQLSYLNGVLPQAKNLLAAANESARAYSPLFQAIAAVSAAIAALAALLVVL